MLDQNILSFCDLVEKINQLSKELETKKNNFYYGGYSFEKVYGSYYDDLIFYQNQLKQLLKCIVSDNE